MNLRSVLASAMLVLGPAGTRADIITVVAHNDNDKAAPGFHFSQVPPPARSNAATAAIFEVIGGQVDSNSGGLEKLHDGRTPSEADQPAENFFFAAGTSGGRVLIDLLGITAIRQIDTYSWHPGARGPQLYTLYGASGSTANFNARPKLGADPQPAGWTIIAKVDTRPKDGNDGGQYGVSIANPDGAIGPYRYLLFDCAATETSDNFGNTFYSEIVVLDHAATNAAGGAAPPSGEEVFTVPSSDGQYEITIRIEDAPDLTDWAKHQLAPTLAQWYPKIIALLPSPGFQPPKRLNVVLRPGRGVAGTSGSRITANAAWVRKELTGEALGALVHETVHVVQQYGRARDNPAAKPNPGWLVEGIADYVRFYLYEPQRHGAEIRARNLDRARYNGSYRVTANFLNWVGEKHDKDIVPQLNAAMRERTYDTNLWSKLTGQSVEQLGEEWKADLKSKTDAAPAGE